MLTKRRFRKTLVALISVGALFAGTPASHADGAPSQIFMQYTNSSGAVKGESQDRNHPNWTYIASLGWGVTAESSLLKGGGASVGKPNPGSLMITKEMDSSSLPIMLDMFQGKSAKSIVFEVAVPSSSNADQGTVVLRYTLTDALVTGYDVTLSDSGPSEKISFVFKSVKIDYVGLGTDGRPLPKKSLTWDIVRMTAMLA